MEITILTITTIFTIIIIISLVFMSVIVFLPLLAYFSYNNRKNITEVDPHDQYSISDVHNSPADSLGQITEEQKASALHQKISTAIKTTSTSTTNNKPKKIVSKASDTEVDLTGVLSPSISSSSLQNINGTMLNIKTPVLGPIPTNGIQPLYGIKHTVLLLFSLRISLLSFVIRVVMQFSL